MSLALTEGAAQLLEVAGAVVAGRCDRAAARRERRSPGRRPEPACPATLAPPALVGSGVEGPGTPWRPIRRPTVGWHRRRAGPTTRCRSGRRSPRPRPASTPKPPRTMPIPDAPGPPGFTTSAPTRWAGSLAGRRIDRQAAPGRRAGWRVVERHAPAGCTGSPWPQGRHRNGRGVWIGVDDAVGRRGGRRSRRAGRRSTSRRLPRAVATTTAAAVPRYRCGAYPVRAGPLACARANGRDRWVASGVMIFGTFIPQGWKMELAAIDDPQAKWAKAVEIARARRRARLRLGLGLRPLPQRAGPGPRDDVRVLDDARRASASARHASGSARWSAARRTATPGCWPRSRRTST